MNDAANEIASRLRDAVGPTAERVWAGTSHRLAAQLLRGHAAASAEPAASRSGDEHAVNAALRDVLAQPGLPDHVSRVRVHARASGPAARAGYNRGGGGEQRRRAGRRRGV